jgi:hypothetical protein
LLPESLAALRALNPIKIDLLEAHAMKADRFVIRRRLLVALASSGLLLLAAEVAAQQAQKPNPYPEHGQIIATRLGAEAVGGAGVVGPLKRWIYHADCGDLYYDLQGGGKPFSRPARMLHSELKSKRPIWTTARTANAIALPEPASPIRIRSPTKLETPERSRNEARDLRSTERVFTYPPSREAVES